MKTTIETRYKSMDNMAVLAKTVLFLSAFAGISLLGINIIPQKKKIRIEDVNGVRHWSKQNELAAQRLPDTGGLLSKILRCRVFHRGPGRYTKTIDY